MLFIQNERYCVKKVLMIYFVVQCEKQALYFLEGEFLEEFLQAIPLVKCMCDVNK